MKTFGELGEQGNERLQSAFAILESLLLAGVRFVGAGGQFTCRAAAGAVTDEQKAILAEHRPEVRYLLGRSEALPSCPSCGGRFIEEMTFDGFANVLCPPCGRCYGCYPISEAAIAKYGDRGRPEIGAAKAA